MPLKEQIGGVRTLYSHNAQFPLSHVHAADKAAMATLLPPAAASAGHQDEPGREDRIVNHTAVEEVLLDIGMLDFGKGVQAKSNVAVWRDRGE